MNAALNSKFDSQSHLPKTALVADSVRAGLDSAARAGVVNRTHRVVRQRAKLMQERRSYVRSLMVPLIVCSALLILSVVAVWSGLYQYQAAEAVQDVAALASIDANNHFLVVLLWFVPVSLACLAAVWFTRFRSSGERGTSR